MEWLNWMFKGQIGLFEIYIGQKSVESIESNAHTCPFLLQYMVICDSHRCWKILQRIFGVNIIHKYCQWYWYMALICNKCWKSIFITQIRTIILSVCPSAKSPSSFIPHFVIFKLFSLFLCRWIGTIKND